MMQNLTQGEKWYSESTKRYEEIKIMPCPYALRCLAKLERQYGFDSLDTPLGIALKLRAEQGIGAEATEIEIQGAKMLRDKKTGQWRGRWKKTEPKRTR